MGHLDVLYSCVYHHLGGEVVVGDAALSPDASAPPLGNTLRSLFLWSDMDASTGTSTHSRFAAELDVALGAASGGGGERPHHMHTSTPQNHANQGHTSNREHARTRSQSARLKAGPIEHFVAMQRSHRVIIVFGAVGQFYRPLACFQPI
jgi:hypothetical protein